MTPHYIHRTFTALTLLIVLAFAACKKETPRPEPLPTTHSPYITRVLEYLPAVGQFTNELPKYEAGDTQEDMNRKALDELKDNKRGLVTLGGWGGYIVVGFDHTIRNVAGQRDFRVLGNAFYSSSNKEAFEAGSCEPGIIMVAYDANHNGRPDEDEWYEIAGSAHVDPTQEPWYAFLKSHAPQADLNCYRDFEMTYYRPANEPASNEVWSTYIRWQDNKGNSGYKVKNQSHAQPYFPQWIKGDKLTFRGTRLPQNGYDQSGVGTYYMLYKFRYGYADNELNDRKDSAIDIDWAVDKKGRKVHLPGVDFIKIYTGVNQENGWLGECSTEISGVNDLHVLKEDIPN